jgi:hypothetical protein
MSRFRHFSVLADYDLLASKHERLNELYFVPFGIRATRDYPVFQGLLSLPELGFINYEQYHVETVYWVFPKPPKLKMSQLPPREGKESRFQMVASSFRVCVQFVPNGIWDRCVICGRVEVTYDIGTSRALHKELRSYFASTYARGEKFFGDTAYAGPDALALQEQGYRLCSNPNLDREHDFKLPSAQD